MDAPLNLTPDGFKQLHNGLAILRSLARNLEPMLNSELCKQFDSAFTTIDTTLAEAYALDFQISTSKMQYYGEVRSLQKFISEWSNNVVEVNGFDQPFAAGIVQVKYASEDAIILEDPSWLDMWKAADTLIRQSGDMHHIFVENFVLDGDTYQLKTGS